MSKSGLPELDPRSYVGTLRRFGQSGPVYEILGLTKHDRNGKLLFRIRVLESGEEAELRVADVLDDPIEH